MDTIVSHHTIEGGRVPPPATDQERLELLEEKRPAILEAMAKIRTRFVAQVAEELPERWEQLIRDYIADRPYEAKSLGREGLARLKRDLRHLQGRARDVAVEHLSGSRVWKQLDLDDDLAESGHGAAEPAQLLTTRSGMLSDPSDALRQAEAEVLPLLRPAFGNGPWLPSAQGRLSQQLEQMNAAYERLSLQLAELEAERKALRRKIASLEAQQLWDNA